MENPTPETPEAAEELSISEGIEQPTIAPSPDDSDAAADLARPPRAGQARAKRRSQISTGTPALLLIALGGLYLYDVLSAPADKLPRPVLIGAALAAIGLSMVARFLFNGRRERGLLFLGLTLLLWLGTAFALITDQITLAMAWPLAIAAVGAALLLTYLFAPEQERGLQHSLLLPGLIVGLAGGVALPYALGFIPASVLSFLSIYWPLIILMIVLMLLPRVLRDRA